MRLASRKWVADKHSAGAVGSACSQAAAPGPPQERSRAFPALSKPWSSSSRRALAAWCCRWRGPFSAGFSYASSRDSSAAANGPAS